MTASSSKKTSMTLSSMTIAAAMASEMGDLWTMIPMIVTTTAQAIEITGIDYLVKADDVQVDTEQVALTVIIPGQIVNTPDQAAKSEADLVTTDR